MKQFFTFAWALFVSSVMAQETPAPAQTKPVWITNATLHLGNGKVIENGVIGFSQGKITYVGNGSEIKINRTESEIIDGQGKHVYPGLIALDTYIGLNEIESISATVDHEETGSVNPNVRALIAFNTDSRVTPTVRSNGVLLAQVTPTGGMISGSSSVVQLDGWNWEDAAYRTDDAIHLNWPNMDPVQAWWAGSVEDQQKQTKEQLMQMEQFFAEAKAYHESTNRPYNARFEGMKAVISGKQALFIHVSQAKGMVAAVNFAEKWGIRPVLVGGEDALLVKEFLLEHKVAVVVKETHRLPRREDDPVDEPYTFPARLKSAGIPFAFAGKGGWAGRNLAYESGTAAAHGLGKEAALQSVTLTAAEILGIEKRTGSLELGKDANLFLCEGDALNMSTSNLQRAWIQGRSISLESKQTRLYEKFQRKNKE